jgi:hypothetical protein
MTVESAATGLPGKGRTRRMLECGVFVAGYAGEAFCSHLLNRIALDTFALEIKDESIR